MNKFKKWLIPVAIVCLLLATLIGCSSAPASLGEIFDPSGNPFANRFSDVKDIRTATFVVAASDSVHKYEVDYRCDGIDDHVQIQAAIDALPATGGAVLLLDGTYTLNVVLTMDSYQTLKGCGSNTILTTTNNLIGALITAVGGAGTEKVDILITDLYLDGNFDGDDGIYWEYVDNSKVLTCWIWSGYCYGIHLYNSDGNLIEGNFSYNNYDANIYLEASCDNLIIGNWSYHSTEGIYIYGASNNNTITGNDVNTADDVGIYVHINSDFNTITGNNCNGNMYGIEIMGSHHNTISGNNCEGNTNEGIYITSSYYANVTGNTCKGNGFFGIELYEAHYATITGNGFYENGGDGIYANNSDYMVISSNNIYKNGECGIYISNALHCLVTGNVLSANSFGTDVTYDNIYLYASDDCLISDNLLRRGAEAQKPRYGINIATASSERNKVIDNDLYDSGTTAKVNDVGTGTIGLSVVAPFVDGTDPQDSGFLLDLDTELARAFLILPDEVQQVRFLKIYARSVILEADKMRLEINVNGGADNEAYTTHQTLAPNTASTSSNFAADDVIYWTLTSAQILALNAGDSIEVKVLHEVAGNGDCLTNAYIRTVEIGYF